MMAGSRPDDKEVDSKKLMSALVELDKTLQQSVEVRMLEFARCPASKLQIKELRGSESGRCQLPKWKMEELLKKILRVPISASSTRDEGPLFKRRIEQVLSEYDHHVDPMRRSLSLLEAKAHFACQTRLEWMREEVPSSDAETEDSSE